MSHPWKFFRAGGFDQVKIETGADLANLDQLDQKLWTALACPTTGIEFDKRTAELIDTDKDGRIRAPELIAAAKFATGALKNPDVLIAESDTLAFDAIADPAIAASARQIAQFLGRKDAKGLSVADVSDANKIFANTTFNVDGVIIAESCSDDALKAAFADISSVVGTVPDRSGKPGLHQAKVDGFFADAKAFSEWQAKAEADPKGILPLGADTAAAVAAVAAIKSKVDDFFGRCRLAAFDARSAALLNRKEEDYAAIAGKELSLNASEVANFPLAQIAPGRSLPLQGALNPAHAGAVGTLVSAAITPLLGVKAELSEADWAAVQGKLALYSAWVAGKSGATTEKLGLARVRDLLGGSSQKKLAELIVADQAKEAEANGIAAVEKLVRLNRDLHRLTINFVNFKDFYDGGAPAIFQAGTLFLDQRSCGLCLSVEDAGRHALMAGLAGTYLAYVECVRRGTGEKLQIVAAFTDGDSDNLIVGRNGLFYDRSGKDYDATITKIIENPISIRQAFWSPYKKFVRMIEEAIAKRAAAADGAATEKLASAAVAVANAEKAKAAEPKKMDVGTVAALGVAFGAIGGFFTAVATGLAHVAGAGPLAVVGMIVGLILLISIPSCIMAYLKLRKRSLGPILDANGWAVNSKARINVPFGTTLTGVAKLPEGAAMDHADAYAEKGFPWKFWLVLGLVLYTGYKWYDGSLDDKLPGQVKSTTVMGTNAPAANRKAEAPKAAEAAATAEKK